MTRTAKRIAAAAVMALLVSACTPTQVAYWYGLHALPLPVVVPEVSAPTGWVDLGHGIWGPEILTEIRRCESRDDYIAQNPSSTASGAYQFLGSTWRSEGHADRYGPLTAAGAAAWQQDEAAVITWQRSGLRPWAASWHCWNR